jgi:hypothetical protein
VLISRVCLQVYSITSFRKKTFRTNKQVVAKIEMMMIRYGKDIFGCEEKKDNFIDKSLINNNYMPYKTKNMLKK